MVCMSNLKAATVNTCREWEQCLQCTLLAIAHKKKKKIPDMDEEAMLIAQYALIL